MNDRSWFRRRAQRRAARLIDVAAEKWLDALDPEEKVGARHHTVPRFHLARFADRSGQLRVRDRATGTSSLRNIRDLAIKDFYTFVHVDGHLDGSFEQTLGLVEEMAAPALSSFIGSDGSPRALTPEERFHIDEFVAHQAVRGSGQRRKIELLTDYATKLTNQHRLSENDMKGLEFAPHQNEHIAMIPKLAGRIQASLAERPAMLFTLDAPLFVTCDEPVLLRGGFGTAEEILLPLSPTQLLVFGRMGDSVVQDRLFVTGTEARDLADEVLTMSLALTLDWMASHPDHPSFAAMSMPALVPLLNVHDGGSAVGELLRHPVRRRPRRLPSLDSA